LSSPNNYSSFPISRTDPKGTLDDQFENEITGDVYETQALSQNAGKILKNHYQSCSMEKHL